MKLFFLWAAILLPGLAFPDNASRTIGAAIPWTTYEAEEMRTTGLVRGPKYGPFLVETESSHQKCVQLGAGEHVEFAAQQQANTIVIRFSLPDQSDGGGMADELKLHINGKEERRLNITSRNAMLYGSYPFTNHPAAGKPRNFYDELRVRNLRISQGDVIRIEKADTQSDWCIIDIVDLENVAPPLRKPVKALSILDFGADGKGAADDTEALRQCVAEAVKRGKVAWLPAGIYKVTGDLVLPSNARIQGAGMWHTTLDGDADLYGQSARRVRLKLSGTNIHLADFAIMGRLNYRNDNEPNDGIVGANCADSSVTRVWIEHTKAGVWVYNGTRLAISGCRFRNLLADGVNFCVGTRESVVENCTARGTGDDCFAIWPAPSDQSFTEQTPKPGHNVFRRCTGQLTFLANGAAIYGGMDNRIEDCLFTDISSGCGVLISTTFPTADEVLKIDNNFSGTTVVKNVDLIRCGGFDHGWTWRGSFQICLHKRSISGLLLSNINIRDSFSDGLMVVAPECPPGQGILANTLLENLVITGSGRGSDRRYDLHIRDDSGGELKIRSSRISSQHNASNRFKLDSGAVGLSGRK